MIRLKRTRKRKKMIFLKKVWKILKPFHKNLYFIFVITVFFETIRMGGPYLFGKILDILINSKGILSFETALFVVAGLGGVRLFSLIIDHITDWIIFNLLINAERYISTLAYEKMVDLSLDYHEKESTGKKINLINKGTDKLIQLVEGYAFEFQPVVLQLLVTAILILFTNWVVGIIFSLSLIPFTMITFHIYDSTKKLREKRHDAYDIASGEVGDTMTNITVVKGFAQEQRENRAYGIIRHSIKDFFVSEFGYRMLRGFGRNLLIEIFYMILLIVGLFEIRANALTIGGLVFLINLIERAYSNIYRLGRIYQRISDAKEPVDKLTALMQAKSSIKPAENPIQPEVIYGNIQFKNVTFAYSKRTVLNNVSFTIPEGSFTALVGKSGSGKSTVAKLLSRYYDPSSGKIVIDGQYDLRELDLEYYRRQTAIVFQDSPVPNRKIWEVISYAAGKKGFGQIKDQVIKAAQLAHAHEFIEELEDGYQTLIGERGVKLSGGQRQRLAIARALFADPKILIMDEPTSHLDTLSEAQIQKALEEISKQRSLTKIIIAHRLSTVQHADQILVMERGKLVEKGTHSELLKHNGVYANIVEQSGLKN
jgi:ABC-type multidrug transport system fused ATPase/permease subunit